jgi:hypothetical protein
VPIQVVDPAVSRTKFERQIAEYRSLEQDYRKRGWLLIEANFPHALVAMVARQLAVPSVVLGVSFDFTNYDVEPPSVRLVDPFTGEPYKPTNLPVRLDRRVPGVVMPAMPQGLPAPVVAQPYLQWYSGDDIPFLCLPGVREYHQHPGHSGDSWELHRRDGAGRLVRLLEVIHQYGVAPIDNLSITLQFIPQVVGFHSNPPE